MIWRKRHIYDKNVTSRWRTHLSRVSYIVLLFFSLSFILLSRVESVILDRVSVTVMDVAGPVLNVMYQPIHMIKRSIEYVGQVVNVFEDNQKLREENRRLLHWKKTAYRLEQENTIFRSALKFHSESHTTYVTARVIGETGGPFAQARLLNAGLQLGVKPGMVVVSGAGLVGRIVLAGEKVSRVLLLTDLNSRVPVTVMGSRHRAVLTGDNKESPLLLQYYISNTNVIKSGDRIATSGDGGLFPPGLFVGIVIAEPNGNLRVRLASDLTRLDVLQVVRYRVATLEESL